MMESCFNDKLSRAETIVVEDLRRDLHSDLTEIAYAQESGSVELLQVYLRIRPFRKAELESGESQDCVAIHPPDTVLLKAPRASLSARLSDKSVPQTAQRFQFSQVFGPDTPQKDIFDGTVKGLVRNVLEGRNSLVFTYGITNSGKTFTFLGPENDVGILPRSLNMIFCSLRGRVFTHMSVKPQKCQDVLMLSREQQIEEALSKRNLLRLLKENDAQKSATSLLSSKTLEDSAELDRAESPSSIILDTDLHTRFSVWVSFCEIYNENIYDLLEQLPGNSARRTNLRLCQDVKGNSFIKDLRWVQVHSADEAFKVMKLGKRNQSIFSTKLNQLSSRSHSIFSVRILRIEDMDTPRVLSVSELSLCDLAGSERCGKTQNKGDRLKEAGNINTSLLSLGKCITALRSSQQARHHVPFRESKLTHYLQGYFTGRGKACMIVNINQCASMYDETLNVLKFSAVAQKVVVLTTAAVPLVVKRSAREVSFIINKASRQGARRTSLLCWEHSQECGEEDVGSEEEDEEEEEEESFLEETIQEGAGKETVLLDKGVYENQLMQMEDLQEQLRLAKEENHALECRIREEVTREFSELFSQMQADYNERILNERELIEERCERRLEIFKNLVGKTSSNSDCDGRQEGKEQASDAPSLDGMLDFVCCDLVSIRQDAEDVHSCLVTSDPQPSVTLRDLEKEVEELGEQLGDTRRRLSLKTRELGAQSRELEDMKRTLERREQRMSELMVMCVEKEDAIAKVQASLDQAAEDATKNSALIKDLLQFKQHCTCSEHRMQMESRKRRQVPEGLDDPHGQPPLKKGTASIPAAAHGLPASVSTRGAGKENRLRARRYLQTKKRLSALKKCRPVTPVPNLNATLVLSFSSSCDSMQSTPAQTHTGFLEDSSIPEGLVDDESPVLQVRSQFGCYQAESNQKDWQITDLEQKCQTLEFSVKELKSQLEEKQYHSDILREKESLAEHTALQLSSQEQQQNLLAMITRLNAMETRLSTAERDCSKLKTCLEAKADSYRKELNGIRYRLAEQDCEIEEKNTLIRNLQQEVKSLEQQRTKHQAIPDSLQSLNSHLQAEVATLRGFITELEEKIRSGHAEKEKDIKEEVRQAAEKETTLLDKEAPNHKTHQMREPVSTRDTTGMETNITLVNKVVELAQKEATLAEKEVKLCALQKTLEEAQERVREEERQALQEARRREVERRRELLAVAEEAIAQKEAELQKRQDEINKLKEELKSLSVNLSRRDSADLREKLTDSKKQIHQVQKAISSMREAEKSLKQKLGELEKVKSQLQHELSSRDRTIQQLQTRSDEHVQLYEKALKDLQARERVIEDMRLALMEQEETQTQMDLELDSRMREIHELSQELENLRELVVKQTTSGKSLPHHDMDGQFTDDYDEQLIQAREQAAQAQQCLEMASEKQQAERQKWLEEKMVLITQAKEAEKRRNQDMRRYADDRERHARQQAQMESLAAQLSEREQAMERWRIERDALVSALEVQLQKLISSIAEKDEQIQQLQRSAISHPPEGADEDAAAELQALLMDREAKIHSLEEQINKYRPPSCSVHRDSATQTVSLEDLGNPDDSSTLKKPKHTRASVTSQGSCSSCPSVLDSSEISTEAGRHSRFPRPELEISFSPLHPDRVALRRQGDEAAVTVKIARTGRKRKSSEMEKDGVESENRRNTRCRNRATLPVHQEEPSPELTAKTSHDTRSSVRGRREKERTLHKIGDFLHSSPTFLGSKAKMIMGLMSGKSPEADGASQNLKRSKRKLYRPNISSPMDIPAHQIIGENPEDNRNHVSIKRRLRTRTPKN